MRRTVAALAVLALAGCGGATEQEVDTPSSSASETETGEPLIRADTYYEMTGVGDFAETPDSTLDTIGQALCSDMRTLEDDETRRSVWVAVNEQADSELQSLGMVLAITARHCPEFFHLWDAEVEEIMGGELPW